MRNDDDTIAAISTPIGQGGIGIVRLSGPDAITIAEKTFRARSGVRLSHARRNTIVYGHATTPEAVSFIDEALVSVMRSPHSYTREDVVEINCHGGILPVRKVLEAVLASGARLAEPGEFTKRAFLNGRLSLAEAEAVMDLITSRTEEGMRIALGQLRGGLTQRLAEVRSSLVKICAFAEASIDFPEDDLELRTDKELLSGLLEVRHEIERLSATFQEARFFREGLSVAIIGKPNVGKSSLLNALLRKDRAIVTEIPGTTRDLIEEYLNIDGLPVRIIDTAGIRESEERVEMEGIRRSIAAMDEADFIILMLDGSREIGPDDIELLKKVRDRKAVIAVNKSDLPQRISPDPAQLENTPIVHISTVTEMGLDDLKRIVFDSNLSGWAEEREGIVVTNVRHKTALDRASAALERAAEILEAGSPLEIFVIELRNVLAAIGEITGIVTTEEILDKIFTDFCIGK